MASKGKGKGKLLTTLNASAKQIINSTKQYEGALDNSFYIKAQMKNGQWLKARIIDCRLSRVSDTKRMLTESSYDYYIHYEGYNRRMDEWISNRERIQTSDELIAVEPTLKKKCKIQGEDKLNEHGENDEHEGMDHQSLIAHEQYTKFKTIDQIEFGDYKCETWYYSPFPTGYHNIECLFICEYCLSFYTYKTELIRHHSRCVLFKIKQPPGDECYRDPEMRISMFEVDGHKNPTYSENLCYISKLFLDHKNLYYDAEPYLFFVMAEYNETGYHVVGYFSKQKDSSQGWNLNCILTFPFHQRKGYGKFLISFSYTISILENKVGTPERPLSDLGRESYLSWWTQRIIEYLLERIDEQVTLANITKATGIKDSDILWALEQKQMIKYQQSTPLICTDSNFLKVIYDKAGRPGIPVKQDLIHWVPYKKSKELKSSDRQEK